MARLVSVLVVLGPCAALLASCGPSVQTIYEGNVRFEHCYRLDIDPHIAPTHREACWKEWQQTYTYGQTRDRVEYAERRIRALASGDDRRPTLDTSPAVIKKKPDGAPSEAPIPTSLHAPPPPTAPPAGKPDAGEPDASLNDEVEAPLPDDQCSAHCGDGWDSCSDSCRPGKPSPDGGKAEKPDAKAKNAQTARQKQCKACREDYRKCMRRCFK